MAANPTGDKDTNSEGNSSESTSTVPASTSTQPPVLPFRHRSNAPYSPYPLSSNHEYPPRSTSSSSSSDAPSAKNDPSAPILVVPPLATLRGRPTPWTRPPNVNDERCIIYCTQTASRRSVGQQPICKTFCWRHLTLQDFNPADQAQQTPTTTTVAASTAEEGATNPAITQTSAARKPASEEKRENGKQPNVLTMPDGRKVVERNNYEMKPGIFGFDGRFVYFGRSRFRAKDRLDSMSHPGLSEDWSVDDLVSKSRRALSPLRCTVN